MDTDYTCYDSSYLPAVVGQNNAGATCWFNSMMQLVWGLPSVAQVLIVGEDTFTNNAFARHYISLMKGACGEIKTPLTANSAIELFTSYQRRLRQLGIGATLGNGQECANEGLCYFIEALGPAVEALFNNVYEMKVICPICKKITSNVRDKSLVVTISGRDVFDTQQKFCNHLHYRSSPLVSWKCDGCNTISNNIQRTEILKTLREIVVVVFDKFSTKEMRWFPQELSFPKLGGGELRYELKGKIEHSGNSAGGHYWAHTKRNEWHCVNDSCVMSGNGEPTPSTFMIAYHLVAA